MDIKDKLVLFLHAIELPEKVIQFLVERYSFNELCDLKTCEKDIISVIGEKYFKKLKSAKIKENIEKTAQLLEKYEIKPVFYYNDEYPKSLLKIENKPLVLYCKGNKKLLNKKSIAIVGTRRPTIYGREVTKYFAKELAQAGLVTVSGLAYGLDMEVAISTLEVKGETIAVLGGGLDKIYPEQNTFLAEKIVNSNGLLVSLYPPLKRPTKYSFVDRNRIISGLSLGTIIIEAGVSSGTLNTANHAIEQGKELFVIPGNIFSEASKGSNRLIDELPDTFTISPEKVLKTLKIDNNKLDSNEEKNLQLADDMKRILSILYEGEKEFDEIKLIMDIDSKSLISLLTRMEINGLIKKLPGNFYSL